MHIRNRLFAFMDGIDKAFGTVAMIGILVLVFYQVMSRYWLGTSLRWSEEVSRYLMVYMVMIGLGAGIKRHKHLGVDAFVELLSGRRQRYVMTLSGVLSAIVYLLMMYFCCLMTLRTLRSGQVSPAAMIPMVLVYVSLPIGFLVGAVRQLNEVYILWHEPRPDSGTTATEEN